MRSRSRRAAFTLVEVLIVVVIMAVLAATILPQFSNSTDDAREAAAKFNVRSLRNQIDLYRTQHAGKLPVISNGMLPALTSSTNASGVIGTAGPSFPYGPYVLTALPLNPFQNSNTVVQATSVPPTAEQGTAGWIYDAATGQCWINTQKHLDY